MFEGVDLPIEIGDTVRMGKFKNKKVVIKTIDWNEKGDLLINGRPAMKFRLEKKADVTESAKLKKILSKLKIPTSLLKNKEKLVTYLSTNPQALTQLLRVIGEEKINDGYPNEEDMKKIKKRVKKVRSKSDSSKEYQYHEIDEFLTTIDMSKIIKEVSNTSNAGGLKSVDSGPSLMFKNSKHYEGRGKLEAEKLGWSVINYVMAIGRY